MVRCGICLKDLISSKQEIYDTKCGHKFHKNCLSRYCHRGNMSAKTNYISKRCPTVLKCRLNDGEDMFPEVGKESASAASIRPVNESHLVTRGLSEKIRKAINSISEDEYFMIETVDDIDFTNVMLTADEKQTVLDIILDYKRQEEGGLIKRRPRRTKKFRRKPYKKSRRAYSYKKYY